MHISFKIIKFYFTLRCSTCFGHHSVHHQELPTAALLHRHTAVTTEQDWRKQPTQHHTVTRHCSIDTRESSSNNRTGLEEATDTTPHGDQRLNVQQWEAPDDGHSGVRNMLNNVE
jgi:hypothetical protein